MRLIATVLSLFLVAGCVTSSQPDKPEPMTLTPEKAAKAPAAAIARATEKACGATYSLTEGLRDGTNEFVVSAYPETGRSEDVTGLPTAAVMQVFIDRNLDLLRVNGHAVGTWCETEGGDCHTPGKQPTCHVDISRTMKGLKEAQALAKACNQRAIAWLRYDGVRILDNGGKGYGDGKLLTGSALATCRQARGD